MRRTITAGFVGMLLASPTFALETTPDEAQLTALVDGIVTPLMAEQRIPGMAIGLSINGEHHYFYYGLADRDAQTEVTAQTLFEIGSVSKLFTAALAGQALASGALSLDDAASRHAPALAGSAFDDISLLELGTYTAGGLPLQFPEHVTDEASMLDYYRQWQPAYPPGTQRLYSNPSIGLLGYLVAERLDEPFADAMQSRVLSPLGLTHSVYQVSEAQEADYAWGYSRDDAPVRVSPGSLDAQAYGVKTNAEDLLSFVTAHVDDADIDPTLSEALALTRTGYVALGDMEQGLGWERYRYPVTLDTLRAGNSTEMALEPQPAERLTPPSPPSPDYWYNKTGSTNGFGAYAALVPSEDVAIVMLANRNYPNAERVEAAYRLLTALTDTQ
ncbi:class C beta-lactamase [Halomonas dongshanensis]|uniref:Beta-lactamase n=1 Tax=Halomonas dongshanensis TaxID=2890835 RepID=A0ABT2EFI3_9GAMM|nr:class C beta-lactamase [Halomonas dongshanensis]MCS2610348.1 beta-lactamase [Halomonas dongshanensis]